MPESIVDSRQAVLTIAGSDSGGGAGIQADLKTFHALGVFGTSAITCITAQNPDGVSGVEALSPQIVAAQIHTVCDGFPVAAAKTGMLYSVEIIRAVSEALRGRRIPQLVVDPVMIATSGASLLQPDAVEALRSELFPLATVITPNLPEAEALCGQTIDSVDAMRAAAEWLARTYEVGCALKGGHLNTPQVTDILFSDGQLHEWRSARIEARETHGTGCTFAAAVTAGLARRMSLAEAVASARQLVAESLRRATPVGSHYPLAT